jgi:comEA protein
MNGKERLASVILVVTLAVGVVATAFHRERACESVPEAAHQHSPDSLSRSERAYLSLDINTATVDELMTLPGIGPTKAGAIRDWRLANGRFTSVDQLVAVKGIGRKTLERIRRYVCINREAGLVGD